MGSGFYQKIISVILFSVLMISGGLATGDDVDSISNFADADWFYTDHSDAVQGVAFDDSGNVYSSNEDGEVHKIDSEGNKEWVYTGHDDNFVWDLETDGEGNVYSGSSDSEVHKIDAETGEKIWASGGSNTVDAIAIDQDNHIYFGDRGDTVYKIDENGDTVWEYDGHSNQVRALETDREGYVYSGSSDSEVHKIDAETGEKIWDYTKHSNSLRSLTSDEEGNVYSGSRDNTVHKIDAETGEKIWDYTKHSSNVLDLDTDQYGNIYSASIDDEVHKIDPKGVTAGVYRGHDESANAVAVDETGFVYSGSDAGEVHKLVLHPLLTTSSVTPKSSTADLEGELKNLLSFESLDIGFQVKVLEDFEFNEDSENDGDGFWSHGDFLDENEVDNPGYALDGGNLHDQKPIKEGESRTYVFDEAGSGAELVYFLADNPQTEIQSGSSVDNQIFEGGDSDFSLPDDRMRAEVSLKREVFYFKLYDEAEGGDRVFDEVTEVGEEKIYYSHYEWAGGSGTSSLRLVEGYNAGEFEVFEAEKDVSSPQTITGTVEGLEEEQAYMFNAFADTGSFQSSSDWVEFVTPEESLELELFSPEDTGFDTAFFEGDLTDLGEFDSAELFFEYREKEEDDDSDWISTEAQEFEEPGSFDTSVSDLEHGTVYEVRLAADYGDGVELTSTDVFETPEVVVDQTDLNPGDESVFRFNESTVELSASIGSNVAGDAEFFVDGNSVGVESYQAVDDPSSEADEVSTVFEGEPGNYTWSVETVADDFDAESVSSDKDFEILEGFVVTGLDESQMVSRRGDPGFDLAEQQVINEESVVFRDDTGEAAGQYDIDFDRDFSAEDISLAVDREERRAFLHNWDDDEEVVENKSVFVPRELGSGVVYVCPDAAFLSSVTDDCSNGFEVETGDESVQGVSVGEVEFADQSYYELEGVPGTGGLEIDPSDDESEDESGDEDDGGSDGSLSTLDGGDLEFEVSTVERGFGDDGFWGLVWSEEFLMGGLLSLLVVLLTGGGLLLFFFT